MIAVFRNHHTLKVDSLKLFGLFVIIGTSWIESLSSSSLNSGLKITECLNLVEFRLISSSLQNELNPLLNFLEF